MHRSKKKRMEDGQIYVVKSLSLFLADKAELLYEKPKIYFLDFNTKDKIAAKKTDTFEMILQDMKSNCPIFTAATTGTMVHLHNFGASFVSKYDGEYFVRKVACADRRALMEWARKHCEICDTRTSEFQQRSAEAYNVSNFANVIPLKF